MQMPNITPAQIAAFVKLVVVLAAALGLNIDGELSDALTGALVAAVAFASAALTLADAIIRHGRSRALASPEAIDRVEKPKQAVIG
jgi:hypothetical protein